MPRPKGSKNSKRLTAEQKKSRGTYIPCRDKNREEKEIEVCAKVSLANADTFKVPEMIKNEEVKNLYQIHIETLLKLNYLASIDKAELDTAYLSLQKAKELEPLIISTNPQEEEFEILYTRYLKLHKKYSEVVERYLVSPQSRLKYVMDNLTIEEKKVNVAKTMNVMERLISGVNNE